jgi:hypothetical protein
MALLCGGSAVALALVFAVVGIIVAIPALILARRGEASMPPGSLSPRAIVGRWLAVLAIVVGIVSVTLAFQQYFPNRSSGSVLKPVASTTG